MTRFTFDQKMTIEVGTIVAGKIIVKDLVVGSEEEPAGITLFDRITKEPYCFVIEDGVPKTYKGRCEGNDFGKANLLDSTDSSSPSGNSEPVLESESSNNNEEAPPVEEPNSSETSSSPETALEPTVEEGTVIEPATEPATSESPLPEPVVVELPTGSEPVSEPVLEPTPESAPESAPEPAPEPISESLPSEPAPTN